MQLARLGNKYFNDREPWRTAKTDFRACANTVHVSLQLCAALSVLLEPVLPHSATRLRSIARGAFERCRRKQGSDRLG